MIFKCTCCQLGFPPTMILAFTIACISCGLLERRLLGAQLLENEEFAFHFPSNAGAIFLMEPGNDGQGVWVVSIENDNSGKYRAPAAGEARYRADEIRNLSDYQPKSSPIPFQNIRQAKNSSEPLEKLFNVRICGLVGYDVLYDKILVISPDNQQVAVLLKEPKIENKLVMKKDIVASAGNLYMSLNVDHIPIQFRLRTQSTDFAINSLELGKLKSRLIESKVDSAVTTTTGSSTTFRESQRSTFVSDQIEIEQYTLKDVVFEPLPENKNINELGLGFMKRFVTVINFKEKQCSFYERKVPWNRWRDNHWCPIGMGVNDGFKLTTTPLKGYLNDLLRKDDIICAINGQSVLGERSESIGERLMSTWLKGGQIEIVRQDKPATIQVPANPMPIGFFGN
jgi:hypothetical protein